MRSTLMCARDRFSHVKSYTGVIPLDYDQVREKRIPDHTLPYIQRWSIPSSY